MSARTTFLLALSSVFAANAQGQEITWDIEGGAAPSARRGADIAYSNFSQKALLFGGAAGNWTSKGDTWEWSATGWTQAFPTTSPPARHTHSLAYDPTRNRAVLFGGFVDYSGGNLNDTWEWDGTNWQLLPTSSQPSPRHAHAMAFDAINDVVLLFGGYDGDSSGGNALNDTWVWDGASWTQLTTTTTPTARHSHAMAFDTVRQRIVMFGGFNQATQTHLNDTWEWNGSDWSLLAPSTSPSPRRAHSIVFDAIRNQTVLFGGYDGQQLGDNWAWDGTNWTLLTSSTSPSPRHAASAAFCPHQQVTLLFGGTNGSDLGDTWTTSASFADAIAYGQGCGSPPLSFTPSATNGRPIIGQDTFARISSAPTLAAGVLMGWSNTVAFPFPLPFDLAVIGMPGCDLLQSSEVIGLGAGAVSATELDFGYPIPPQPSITGTHVFIQAFAFSPGANEAQIIVSNGIEWILGDV